MPGGIQSGDPPHLSNAFSSVFKELGIFYFARYSKRTNLLTRYYELLTRHSSPAMIQLSISTPTFFYLILIQHHLRFYAICSADLMT